MIIVTGATGQLGRRIVERLLTRVPAHQVGVSVRDPGKAQALADRGVRVRQRQLHRRRPASPTPSRARPRCSSSPWTRWARSACKQHRGGDRRGRRGGRPPHPVHQPDGRERVVALPGLPRPRRHRGGAARLRRAVHRAAQRVLRHERGAVPRPRRGDRATSRSPPTGRSAGPRTPTWPRRPPPSWPTRAASTAPRRRSPRRRRSPSTTSPASPAEVTGRAFTRTTVPDDEFREAADGRRRPGRGGRPAARHLRRQPGRRVRDGRPDTGHPDSAASPPRCARCCASTSA